MGVLNPSPVVPSIDDEGDDGIDLDDDEASEDNERGRKRVRRKRTDFQWLYMVALQKRLRKELKSTGPLQVNGLERKWLIEWLEIHDWNIPWYCATHICKLLQMDAKQISLPAYYCDIKVWVPEKQHGIEAMPPCPCCALRNHREEFEKNQRVKNMMAKSLKGREALEKLHRVIKPPESSQPKARINMPSALPQVSVNATGNLPESEAVDRSRGQRGPDRNPGSRPPRKSALREVVSST